MPTITAPFQRRITNPLQRPLSSDLNLQAFYDSVTQSYMAGVVYSASPGGNPTFDTGFIGNSFRCFASTTSREVVVQKGVGFIAQAAQDAIGGIVGVNSGSYSAVVCEPDDPDAAGINLPCDELAAGLNRIDIVCVASPNYPTAYENIGILNSTASTFSFLNKPTQFTENAFQLAPGTPDFLQVVTGTPTGGAPVAPSVPSGYLEIGRIYVPAGSGNLSNSDIEDRRPVLIPHGARSMALSFDSNLGVSDPNDVVGFDFGNNGVHAVVRPVYVGGPSGEKYFEVYVSSGTVSPSAFQLVAGGAAVLDNSSLVDLQFALLVAVKSRSSVSRDDALPYFEAAGTFDALIGPTVAKFIVVVGQSYTAGGNSYIDISRPYVEGFINPMMIRLSLFAQAF